MVIQHTKTYTQKQYVDLGLTFIRQSMIREINEKSKKVHWSTSEEFIERSTIGVNYKGEKVKIEPTVCIKLIVEAE